ncbi:MAG: TolC family protein [Bacteroidetes bacterium]|nr:TolC family protein [Bacteroidota bacterium]
MTKYFLILISGLLISVKTYAQTNISLQKAIETAISNNYDIRIVRNEQQILSQTATAGNAGMLPKVDLGLTQSNSLTDSKQKFSTGAESDKTGAAAHNLNAYAQLNWTVFDGFKMFATYNKLKEIEAAGESTVRMQIEQTTSQVIAAYYNIVKQKALLTAIDSSLKISQTKEEVARAKFQTGIYSKVEWLQAQVDLNEGRANYKRQLVAIDNAKVALNKLLAQDVTTDIDVLDNFSFGEAGEYNQLLSKLTTSNSELVRADRYTKIAGLTVKEYQSLRYPVIGLNGSYSLTNSNSQSGLILESRSKGINYGFTVTYNLFNGFNTSHAIKNARLDYENSKISFDQLKNSIEGDLLISWKNFKSLLEIAQMEEQNSDMASETVRLALDRYRNGTISELQLKDIQQSYLLSQSNYISAAYDAKIAETSLLQISGNLIK